MSQFWILFDLRMVETVKMLELWDVQSSSQIITTSVPTPNFLQAGSVPVTQDAAIAQPTVSEH